MAGVGEGAAAGDRVVHRVDAGGEVDLGEFGAAGLVRAGLLRADGGAEAAGDLVEVREDFGRLQVELGEGADGGAQFAHGDGGPQAPAHDVPDDEGGAVAGQFDDVEPVAADLGGGGAGEVAAGDVEARGLGVAGREQAALEDEGPLVLAAVEAGVVDADGGAGGEFDGEGPVALPEGLAALGPGELDESDDGVVGDHGDDQRGLDELALGSRHRPDPAGPQGPGARRVEGVAVDGPDLDRYGSATAAARPVPLVGSEGVSETALAKATLRSSALPAP